jgi:hypothetical protein
MRLLNVVATPNPIGNRIDLHWKAPDSAQYPRVRVVRREGTYPMSPNPASARDGVVVPEMLGQNYAVDNDLNGEITYYYALFPFKTTGPNNTIDIDNTSEQIDVHNRISAMATAPYNFAGQMYDLLPAIYHRYDTVPPTPIPGILEKNKQAGQLRRFLDLPGTQLDQLYSFARAMLDLYNLDRVDGSLLPLLAEWIGWKTDYRREIEAQRNEIRNALAMYETIGLIPTVEATVKRITAANPNSGWESKTKEFVHNVFLSNRPERLNIWARQRGNAGTWSVPTQPLSLNFAYEGRPAIVRDRNGSLWLFYHTLRKDHWEIWYKTLTTFNLASAFASDLDKSIVSIALQQAFASAGFPLPPTVTVKVKEKGNEWQITEEAGQTYLLKKEDTQLTAYYWAPSQPLMKQREPTTFNLASAFASDLDKSIVSIALQQAFASAGFPLPPTVTVKVKEKGNEWQITEEAGQTYLLKKEDTQLTAYYWAPSQPIDKHPTTALQDATLWVLWDTYNEADQRWRINYRKKTGESWSPIETFADAATDRRLPSAVSDNAGGLWLFWLEKVDARWQLKYNRHNGTNWQLNSAATFPLDNGKDPEVEDDVFVLFHPTSTNQSLWVFWTRQEPSGTTQARYTIAYRVKQGTDPNVSDWENIRTLPKAGSGDYHDREPAPILDSAGNIELFWSSKQTGNWSAWRNTLDITTHAFGATAEQITNNPYSQRAPLAISIGTNTLLVYRSNESLTYTSQVYSATQTADYRYAGSITADARNAEKVALRGKFGDFQGYTYDIGLDGQRMNEDWYARDTIGLYLTPDTPGPVDPITISRINQIIGEFMPVTDRVVFIT